MQDEQFEWDDEKAAQNFRDHGVAFSKAVRAFADQFAVEWIDNSAAYGEERRNLLGIFEGVILHVTYTERGERLRIISAGGRSDMSKTPNYRQNAT
jgi:uncharacterized DUF497 family protein